MCMYVCVCVCVCVYVCACVCVCVCIFIPFSLHCRMHLKVHSYTFNTSYRLGILTVQRRQNAQYVPSRSEKGIVSEMNIPLRKAGYGPTVYSVNALKAHSTSRQVMPMRGNDPMK